MRKLLIAAFAVLPIAAHAQNFQRIPTCGSASPGPGVSPGYIDANGNQCGVNLPTQWSGNGSLATSTTSALLNTLTVNSSAGALPSKLTLIEVINVGSTDAAICENTSSAGATCTCPENGVAATNGVTLPAGGGGYVLNLAGVSSANPTVVACSGTPILQFRW